MDSLRHFVLSDGFVENNLSRKIPATYAFVSASKDSDAPLYVLLLTCNLVKTKTDPINQDFEESYISSILDPNAAHAHDRKQSQKEGEESKNGRRESVVLMSPPNGRGKTQKQTGICGNCVPNFVRASDS